MSLAFGLAGISSHLLSGCIYSVGALLSVALSQPLPPLEEKIVHAIAA